MKKPKTEKQYAERQHAEADFLRWWSVERSGDKFKYVPAVALVYLESIARSAFLTAKGLVP